MNYVTCKFLSNCKGMYFIIMKTHNNEKYKKYKIYNIVQTYYLPFCG